MFTDRSHQPTHCCHPAIPSLWLFPVWVRMAPKAHLSVLCQTWCLSLAHAFAEDLSSPHSSCSSVIHVPLPSSVVTYKSYWQPEAHLAGSESHSNQSVLFTHTFIETPCWFFLCRFIIRHRDSSLCPWTVPFVISSALDLLPRCIWQPSGTSDTRNNKTDRYRQYTWRPQGHDWENVKNNILHFPDSLLNKWLDAQSRRLTWLLDSQFLTAVLKMNAVIVHDVFLYESHRLVYVIYHMADD